MTDTFEDAACRKHDPELFFDKERSDEAVLVCYGCPLLNGACLTAAVSMAPPTLEGVWAGLASMHVQNLQKRELRGEPRLSVAEVNELRHGVSEMYAVACPCRLCTAKRRYDKEQRDHDAGQRGGSPAAP